MTVTARPPRNKVEEKAGALWIEPSPYPVIFCGKVQGVSAAALIEQREKRTTAGPKRSELPKTSARHGFLC